MSLVERIKTLCDSKDTTLIGLEREIGLGRGTMRRWDDNSPSGDKLQKVAQYFNVSVDYLLYGFDRANFIAFVNAAKYRRSIKEFSDDTGIDEYYLNRLCSGFIYDQPPIDIVEKIADNNDNEFIVDRSLIFKAAGYKSDSNSAVKYIPGIIPSPINPDLSNDESDLLTRFRKLSPKKQKLFIQFLDGLEIMKDDEQAAAEEVG
jgi:transcriptional regulator with XRE-family HTH domain